MNLELNGLEVKSMVAARMLDVLGYATCLDNGANIVSQKECYDIICEHLGLTGIQKFLLFVAIGENEPLEDMFSSMFLTEADFKKISLPEFGVNAGLMQGSVYKDEKEFRIAITREVIDILTTNVLLKERFDESGANFCYYVGESNYSGFRTYDGDVSYGARFTPKHGSVVIEDGVEMGFIADFEEEYKGFVILSDGCVIGTKGVKL